MAQRAFLLASCSEGGPSACFRLSGHVCHWCLSGVRRSLVRDKFAVVCAGGCLGAWPLAHSRSSACRENVATMLVAEDVVASVAAGSLPSGAAALSTSAAAAGSDSFAPASFHSFLSKEFELNLP